MLQTLGFGTHFLSHILLEGEKQVHPTCVPLIFYVGNSWKASNNGQNKT